MSEKTFGMGSSASEVLYTQGCPDQVMTKETALSSQLQSWDGLVDQLVSLPEGGFVFLYQPVIGNIFIGCRCWIAFNSDGKVMEGESTSGTFRMKAQ